MEEFMLAGYPDTRQERVKSGVLVVLKEFGDGTQVTWEQLKRMYAVSWITDPNAVRTEFISRGFKALLRLGSVLNEIVSFGFDAHIIDVGNFDTQASIEKKCNECISRVSSKLLVLIVFEKRLSLLVPCWAQKFVYMYFNPNRRRKLDEFIFKSFRTVCDLGVSKLKHSSHAADSIINFVRCLSNYSTGNFSDTDISHALRPESIAEALQQYVHIIPGTVKTTPNIPAPIVKKQALSQDTPVDPPRPEMALFAKQPPQIQPIGMKKVRDQKNFTLQKRKDPSMRKDPARKTSDSSRMRRKSSSSRSIPLLKPPRASVDYKHRVSEPKRQAKTERSSISASPVPVRLKASISASPAPISPSPARSITSIGGSCTSVESFKLRYLTPSISSSVESDV